MPKIERKKKNPYRWAAVVFAIFWAFNVGVLDVVFTRTRVLSKSSMNSIQFISEINDLLAKINENISTVILVEDYNRDSEKRKTALEDINRAFDSISKKEKNYEAEKYHGEEETDHYNQAKAKVDSYNQRIQKMYTDISNGNITNNSYYTGIYPIQAAAREDFSTVIHLVQEYSAKEGRITTMIHGIAHVILFLFIILGEITVYRAAKRAKRDEEELEERSNALSAAGKRLEISQQKMQDIALTNILTGMKNRYALENDIINRLESDQFNIAVFDLDRFRQINDMFGYDFGDEYLAMVAEQLKENFSDVAEIYNIVGNEFCFIFNSDLSDSQVQRTADKILAVMSSQYDVNRIMTQLTASGSIYHYLPNDCLNLDSLLIKMDTTLRQAKANGGNAIYKVNSL
ncbi:MAG: diguanylate cyclase [Ruminococcus sp.]|nr:diguanylate cyclase [Ruminococcus sp.]